MGFVSWGDFCLHLPSILACVPPSLPTPPCPPGSRCPSLVLGSSGLLIHRTGQCGLWVLGVSSGLHMSHSCLYLQTTLPIPKHLGGGDAEACLNPHKCLFLPPVLIIYKPTLFLHPALLTLAFKLLRHIFVFTVEYLVG